MVAIHDGLNNAYILFSFILGAYAVMQAMRGGISGNFWGAMWTNTGLAGIIFLIAMIMTLQGLRPYGYVPDGREIRWVYYLYDIYFVISLPGLFTLLRGSDNPRAAIWFSGVAIFNALSMIHLAYYKIDGWG